MKVNPTNLANLQNLSKLSRDIEDKERKDEKGPGRIIIYDPYTDDDDTKGIPGTFLRVQDSVQLSDR